MEHPLALYRKRNNVPAGEIAKLAKTTRQTVHRIENGDQTPSLDMVARLIEATNGALKADDFIRPGRAA